MAIIPVIRVLVIDDSAYNRRALSEIIEAESDMSVIGKAGDGEEGLKLALSEYPDVITLDLEMPRINGFAFLRILMAKRPTPVIVISSHDEGDNVFRALELGALDFVVKPSHRISPEIKDIGSRLVDKIRMVRKIRRDSIHPIPAAERISVPPPRIDDELGEETRDMATRVIALAASTGGPTALTRVLKELPAEINAGIVIVQHMPPHFTTNFAERLDRLCKIRVHEATGVQLFKRGVAYIAPGDQCLELRRTDKGLVVAAVPPLGDERYIPSADRLFESVAMAAGSKVIAAVLTGMGNDGSKGVTKIHAAGGLVIAEDESTAVISGMPYSAVKTGVVFKLVPLNKITQLIKEFAR
jgi:two-component system, chemotaxis family, protein-glutamate methylesterase/glutaminase